MALDMADFLFKTSSPGYHGVESRCGEYHAARSALLSKLASALLSYTLAITFRNPYKFKHNTYKFKHNTYKFKHNTETFITNEGMYTSQFIYAGKNAALTIGSVLHLSLLCKDKNVSYVYVLSKKALELSCK
ncbi:unnamed protein product [Alternaria alternata]|uniref:uncharacterized protein n=1 Tax=Alternaria postmessia TaxID=1187938 RepID=UPI002224ECA4|nr:uncharacterized protein J4E82_007974 [Alternaria postmessia]KAI5373330.1 hypothetical protein J4E82_007974 [Alternaria postmessia]